MRLKSQKQKQNSNLTEPLKIKVLFVLPVCAASARNGGNILIILSANKIQHTHTHTHTTTHVNTQMHVCTCLLTVVSPTFLTFLLVVCTHWRISITTCLVLSPPPCQLLLRGCFELLPIESLWVKDFTLLLFFLILFCILIEYALWSACVRACTLCVCVCRFHRKRNAKWNALRLNKLILWSWEMQNCLSSVTGAVCGYVHLKMKEDEQREEDRGRRKTTSHHFIVSFFSFLTFKLTCLFLHLLLLRRRRGCQAHIPPGGIEHITSGSLGKEQ